jgi:hypothetical protein
MTFSDPSQFHPEAADSYLRCLDLTAGLGGSVSVCEDKFSYVSFAGPRNREQDLILIWSWRLGTLLAVSFFFSAPLFIIYVYSLHIYDGLLDSFIKTKQRLTFQHHGRVFNSPNIISSENFLTVGPNDHGRVVICVYEINERRTDRIPRRLRSFELPDVDASYVDVECTPMVPVYVGREARDEGITSRSIYSDHEWLCHIRVTGPRVTRDYLVYPSVFLSPRYWGKIQVPWESWGPHNVFCFEYECDGPCPVIKLTAGGDRVVVCRTDDPSEDHPREWYLYMVDFRPARVKRAHNISSGHPVWPREPVGGSSTAAVRGDHHSLSRIGYASSSNGGLPYMETTRLKFVACEVSASMDCERIVINKVG